jgi:hypothetical protein
MEQMENGLIIGGKQYQVTGRILRTLALYDELIEEVSDPVATIREIRERKFPADLFTFWQRPPETTPKFPYHMEWDNLAVVEISTYENWLKHQVRPNTRKKVRKAEKLGLVVRVEPFSDKLVAGLMELFNETPVRRGKRYPYYGWDVEKVKHAWATELDRTLWVAAYYQEELVGFIKLIVCDRLARASGTLAKEAHRDKSTMNALIASCVELCASKGVPRLVYGRFAYGRKGEDSLTDFKRRNGFEKVDVPRYYVPLSIRGRIGLRLGLHHSLNEMIPGSAQRALMKIRSKWYDLSRKNKPD